MFVSIKEIPQGMNSKEVLGGKGFGLAYMQSKGLNVPPAFVLPTWMCAEYKVDPAATMAKIAKDLPAVMLAFHSEFGYMPLLSVRSGARVSMPGMMDTILNVGLDQKEGVPYLSQETYEDCVVRLVSMYGSVVKGLDRKELEEAGFPGALTKYQRQTGEDFPQPEGQLLGSIEAVFKSWDNDRAKFYRKMNNIPEEWGTAVVIQAMVFGNLNDKSGTGVLFTRNPDSGLDEVTGEFLVNAQGEDVVAGIRTPMPLSKMEKWNKKVSKELMETVVALEKAVGDMQDVEFTVQDGKLYILQTRSAKRSPKAAVKVAYDMLSEGLIDLKTALSRVTIREIDLAQQTVVDPSFTKKPAFTGIPACSGVVSAKAVFSAQAAIDCKEPCILITQETTPEDIAGMDAAVGVITMTGGATSHAAVVARGMNKPCVVGVGADLAKFEGKAKVGFDGATGRVWLCEVPVIDGKGDAAVTDWFNLAVDTMQVIPAGDGSLKAPVTLVDLTGPSQTVDGAVGKVVAALSGSESVYVDLSQPEDVYGESFNSLFGLKFTDFSDAVVAKLNQVLAPAEKAVVTLIGAYSSDFSTIGVMGDLESMVMAEGTMAFSTKKMTPAMKKVIDWKVEGGMKTVSIGKYRKGMTSMISPVEAFKLMVADT